MLLLAGAPLPILDKLADFHWELNPTLWRVTMHIRTIYKISAYIHSEILEDVTQPTGIS
jgi:hypothetical protein